VAAGGLLVAAAWVINSLANSLPLLYLGAALGGIGVGCVYGTCVGNALKWFPDRRGLAAGITAAGFGVGSAFTIIPIQNIIRSSGYEAAFLWFGLGQGLIILALAPLLRTAPHDLPAATTLIQTRHSHSPAETLRSPVFWLLHDPLLFVLLGGLVFFAWGEIYSLFPSTWTDCYGPRYATTNAGLLYTAKGVAGLLVPIGSLLVAETGNWHILFTAAAAMNALAAVLAILVLRPMRLTLVGRPAAIPAG
jgi:MFS family permease